MERWPVSFGAILRRVSDTCPQTRHYWKVNPPLWPVDSLALGSETYSKIELQDILQSSGSSDDASLVSGGALIAAELNTANGSDPGPASSAIADADVLLTAFSRNYPAL